ncbi:hypothetical protein [Kaarinaea lacus]
MTNSTVNRILSVVFGSSLIVTTMAVSSAPLGGFAVLPLIGIPMILSGIYGENLLGELTAKPVNAIKARLSASIMKVFKRNAIPA